MLFAAIDIHKHAFQAAVLDPESGVVVEERFSADRESFARWAEPWRGRVAAVAIEATTGWRWVWRELVANGFDVRLAEPVQTRALLGRRRSQDGSARCALAGAAVGEGDAARVVDPAGADPRAARPYTAAQGAGRGPAPLGSAPARLPLARGLALLALESAQAARAALGGGAPALRARSPAGRLALGGDGGAARAAGDGRRRVASLRPRRRALPGVAVDLRDRADPRLPPAGRDRRGAPLCSGEHWARPERSQTTRRS